MGIDHRRRDVVMPEQLLDRPAVVTGLEQMGRERVTQRMATRSLGKTCPSNGILEGALHYGFVQVVPANFARLSMAVLSRRREDPMPRQLAPGARVLHPQRVG
jgi:hypothetical protein